MSNLTGKIVVNADEWTLSDIGFQKSPDAATFALNVAKYFVGDSKGKFHVLSTNWGLTQSSLEQTMTKAGHTWTKGLNIPINLATLGQYDAIFIGGDPVDNQVLIEYIKNGGRVYLCAGTGQGGSQGEANNWNTFLAAFGLKYEGVYNAINANLPVNSTHPLFAGVKALFQNAANPITDLQPDSPLNKIILTNGIGQGAIATAEFIKTPAPKSLNGQIVVNGDEWTLSDQGFQKAPDAATFAINVAQYFVGDEKGKFHVLSNNWGLTQSSLEQTMTKAGHTWTKGMNIPIDLATLQKYDAIFIGGDPVDNQVLIQYVKNGGKVYLCAGTGQGGAQTEANNWNTFLAAFGLQLSGSYNTISANLPVNQDNSLFAGVNTLFQNAANPIIDLQPDSPLNQIILTNSSGQGAIATAEFIKTPAPQPAPEVVPAPQPAPEPVVTPPAPEPAAEIPTPAPEVVPAPQPAPEPVVTSPIPQPVPEPLVSDSEEFTITATKDVTISKLVYKGAVKRTQADEYLEISNPGKSPANISGWKITSAGSLKQVFTFPQGTILEAGKSFRIYTNEVHPETGGFSFGSGTAIWNDAGDEAKLFDTAGNNVSTLAYGKNTIGGIKEELKVPQLQVIASHAAINKQMSLPGKITFTEALSSAIKSFLEDGTNSDSPLAIILKKPTAYGLPKDATKAMATEKLRSLMNQNAKLILYPTPERKTAENGETVAENWIFELSLPGFAERTMHWAIVPRSGNPKVGNYGIS